MNATQTRALQEALKFGWAAGSDSYFSSYRASKMALSALVKSGHLTPVVNEYGTQYEPTEKAREEHRLNQSVAKLIRR